MSPHGREVTGHKLAKMAKPLRTGFWTRSTEQEIGGKDPGRSFHRFRSGRTEASWIRRVNKGRAQLEDEDEMKSVYLLWHSHPTGRNEHNEKLIGVYPTEDAAKSAQNRISEKPGFANCPEGFEIVKYRIGEDHWTEGYFTE
jgi:hypothetical protein